MSNWAEFDAMQIKHLEMWLDILVAKWFTLSLKGVIRAPVLESIYFWSSALFNKWVGIPEMELEFKSGFHGSSPWHRVPRSKPLPFKCQEAEGKSCCQRLEALGGVSPPQWVPGGASWDNREGLRLVKAQGVLKTSTAEWSHREKRIC